MIEASFRKRGRLRTFNGQPRLSARGRREDCHQTSQRSPSAQRTAVCRAGRGRTET